MASAAADPSRNTDGTFKKTADIGSTPKTTTAPSGTYVPAAGGAGGAGSAAADPSRNTDGTFKAGSQATNPDNFANRPTKEVQELAKEGGKHSHDNDGK